MLNRFRLFSAEDIGDHRALVRARVPDCLSLEPIDDGPFRSDVAAFPFAGEPDSSWLASVFHAPGLTVEFDSRAAVWLMVPFSAWITVALGRRMREIRGGGVGGLLPVEEQRIRRTAGHHLMLRVDPSRLANAMAAFECDTALASILDEHFCEPHLTGLQDLVDEVRHLIRSLDRGPDEIVDLALFRAAYDQLLVLRLANVLAVAAAPDGRPAIHRHDPALRRADEYIRAHADDNVDLIRLAQHVGLSLRSLQVMFRRTFDCTLVQYIRRHRLAMARRRLEAASDATIAEIARSSGFAHLGRFTAAYRAEFGELPRQTRQRSRRTLSTDG
ncbi:helix-turn-helix domain-containing protein [Rhodoplanes serenus]|uniref:Helix-turn-helix domain-containing protein n=1 Tax=Rhodoplanes serenus TaxID=200615 RepID=A0A9X4XKL9_9BRAD|nr:helix-turn-helix domain-containing protein [Rhodoplanes serenus]